LAISRADIQYVRSLGQKKERQAAGCFIAEGVKVVSELIDSPLTVEAVYSMDESFVNGLTGDFRSETVSAKELERMSQLTTPNVTVAIARIPQARQVLWKDDLVLALDGIRDPGNLGTIIRTACWFGVRQILCSHDCVDAFGPKVVQGAMGALFHSSIIPCNLDITLHEAQVQGYRVLCASLNGSPLGGLQISSPTVLVIGSESHGVSAEVQEICDLQVRIPDFGGAQVESLNAAVATGILLAEMRKQHER
jgi:RNA methyltransferase, TrmH family